MTINLRHRSLLLLLTTSAALAPTAAFAAEPLIEEVVVTGSRIKSNASSPQPVSSFDSEDLTMGGKGDIAEILNDSPALLSSITAANSLDNGANNLDDGSVNNIGGSALNLRGLGIERTLTLVNGRRHVAGIEGTAAVDPSSIPTALVERVEILSGGASAVYGPDAVTGVVNFILKDDYEGLEATAETGFGDGSYNETRLSVLGGLNFDGGRGNIAVSFQYEKRDGLEFGDRDFLANNGLSDDDQNPALRFQTNEISATTPNLASYYDFAVTGQYPVGLRIPSQDDFVADYTAQFGSAPNLTQEEIDLFNRAASAPPRAILPGRTFNITGPTGVIALGDFGTTVPLGSEPDLDGNGVADCLDSFTGYNSSLDGASSFGIAGGCWTIDQQTNELRPYNDGLVAGSFNHFGAEDSYIRPNRRHAIPEEERFNVNVIGHYDFSEKAIAFWEAKYVNVETEIFEQAHNFTDLLYGAPDNPYLPAELTPFIIGNGLGFGGIDGGLHISRDSDDWGDNVTTNERETVRFVFGMKGDITDNMEYEVSVNWGRFERNAIDREEVIMDRFFAAIDAVVDPATGETVCRSDLDPTAYPRTTPFDIPQYVGGGVPSSFFTFQPGDGQCQPMNIWAGRGAMSQESIDFVTFDREVNEEIEQVVISAFVAGDTEGMFSLPGGPLSWVAGLEYRDESTEQNFGAFDQGILPVSGVTYDGQAFSAGDWIGDVSNAKSLGPTPATRLLSSNSSYDFFDYYVELRAPILMGAAFAEELSVDLAFRQSDNSEFGTNDTYKAGVVWAPINDVTLRYTISEATRVPNLYELFSPEQGARFRPADPCDAINIGTSANPSLREANCIADLQANGVNNGNIFDANGNYAFEDPLSAGFPGAVGGNPNLMPETAETESIGIVLQPRFIPGLSFTVDYVSIEITDAITSVSSQNIVDQCYDAPTLGNQFCGLISRNDDPGSAQSGGLDFLRQVQLNFGAANYEGYDYAVEYAFGFSALNFVASVGYTDVQTLEFVEGGVVDDELGEMRRPAESGRATLSMLTGAFSVSYAMQYLGKQTLSYEDGVEIETAFDNYGNAAFTDSSTFIHDIRGTFEMDNFVFFGGISNFTDEEPYVTERAYPVSAIGRYGYMGLTYRM